MYVRVCTYLWIDDCRTMASGLKVAGSTTSEKVRFKTPSTMFRVKAVNCTREVSGMRTEITKPARRGCIGLPAASEAALEVKASVVAAGEAEMPLSAFKATTS